MNNEYNQQLKQLFRSNTIVNIKLGISLALSQGYSWNYIAEKCLEEWLLFDRYKNKPWGCGDYESKIRYVFTPNDTMTPGPGLCWFEILMIDSHYEVKAQLKLKNWIKSLEKEITSSSLEEIKQPVINKMEEFLKLIYNNDL